jgi:hypothetical protein
VCIAFEEEKSNVGFVSLVGILHLKRKKSMWVL